jgi:hypothetical protein
MTYTCSPRCLLASSPTCRYASACLRSPCAVRRRCLRSAAPLRTSAQRGCVCASAPTFSSPDSICRRRMACRWRRLAHRLARCERSLATSSPVSPPVSPPSAPATADPFLRNLPPLVPVSMWLVLAAAAAILTILLVTHHPPSYFITAAAFIAPIVVIRASVSHGMAEAAARVPRGPRGVVLSSADLRRTRVLREGAHAGGLASRVGGGMGAIGERALLARTRRDEIGDCSREVVPAGPPPDASLCCC